MHPAINHDETPIRLFQSDFLEFFTHIHPAVVVCIWLPISILLFIHPVQAELHPDIGTLIGAFLFGLLLWTPSEYLLHRFVFHYHAKSPRMERITFLFHGIHHAQPQCKTRLVMPPIVSIPMAAIFYGIFGAILGKLFGVPAWVNPVTSGFMVGYLIYDLTHYATHHFPMRSEYAKYIKRYHMLHHYKTPNARFGVSSPFWDIVFKTKPSN
jgi:sterol desaturase/sphingolipid hydroxylase (fatty acid hydroxylase superfamily)